MKMILSSAAVMAAVSTMAIAQTDQVPATQSVATASEAVTTAVMPADATAPVIQKLTLPANSEIAVTPSDDLTSKGIKEGHVFAITTVFDVIQNGVILIPKGTVGKATVTYRTGKGAFGKSAKMEVSFNSLDLGGRQILLTGMHRQEGDGNTGATLGAVAAAGVIGGVFVTGKSAKLPHGRQLQARTGEVLVFEVPTGSAQAQSMATLTNAPVAAVTEVK
jgi:hypothetical protein